jgi:hypothetical protein
MPMQALVLELDPMREHATAREERKWVGSLDTPNARALTLAAIAIETDSFTTLTCGRRRKSSRRGVLRSC